MSPGQLAAKVQEYPELLLLCDYDGTLVPLAPRPEEAVPDPCLLRLLRQLVSRPGLHLAVISGRTLADLRNLLPVPGLLFAALHGSQVAGPEGPVIDLLPPPPGKNPWPEILGLARQLAAGVPGLLVENKGDGVALHYRLAQPGVAAGILEEFRHALKPFLQEGLELIPGHRVLEVRRRGVNKGLAVTYFTRRWPRAFPVYLGDDRTDEDAFAALPGNGLAIGVGQRQCNYAHCYLASPAEVIEFLQLINRSRTSSL